MRRQPGAARRLNVFVLLAAMTAVFATPAAAAGKSAALLPGSTGKEPISIDAAKLDYFDKEQKLVYAGDVVAKQGDSTLKASVLTIFMSKDARKSEAAGPSGGAPSASPGSISRMEAAGPVTVINKDEVGTGDSGSYDKGSNKVTLIGNVTLTQATNIIRGDRLVYDMTTGQAQVSSGQTRTRVQSVFTPQSGGPATGRPAKPPMPLSPGRPAQP